MKNVLCVATDDLMPGFLQPTLEQTDITVQFVMVADEGPVGHYSSSRNANEA